MDYEPFDRYRPQLTALASEEASRAALETTPFWPPRLHWTATFDRFYPGCSPYAIQVFEACDGERQHIARVEAFDTLPVNASNDDLWTPDAIIGLLRVTSIAADTGLATLSSVLGGDTHTTVVRYHPGLRCTVRSLRNGREVFGKVFRDDRGRELRDDYERLWCASVAGELSFAVARPVAWDSASRTLWQAALPGCPARLRLRTDEGPALARRIGEALGSLAQSHVPASKVFTARDQIERSLRHGEELVGRVPFLADQVTELLGRLSASQQRQQGRAGRPIHGAPIPAQWLAATERLGLIDFDNFATGDPELDIGCVLADLDFESLPREHVCVLQAEAIRGWEGVAGPLDRRLVDSYRGYRHLRKALRAASAIRPDGDRRAAASLHRSVELLREQATV
jgi:hypothetical protein